MSRHSRRGTANYTLHVFNRAVQNLTLFETSGDYAAFLKILREAMDRVPAIRLFGYAVMPTHWHLVTWPTDERCLSRSMHWLTTTHARRWREARGNTGRGAVYQGRFQAIPVQQEHFLRLMRYVERNPVAGRCVARVEDWPWTSAVETGLDEERPALSVWPVPKPAAWLELLNVPASPKEVTEIRRAIRLQIPIGEPRWREATMASLHWVVPGRRRGRPRKANLSGISKT